jgi:hypothetical protein
MPSRLIKWATFLSFAIATHGRASAIEPTRAGGQESFISHAIFVNSQLWLLTDTGLLSSITEGSDQQVDIPLSDPAFDMWIQDGDPAVITGDRRGGKFWTLRRWSHSAWTAIAKVATNGDQLVGVGSFEGVVTLLTSRRLIDIVGGDQRSLVVAWPKGQRLAGVSSIYVTRDSVLVGFNIGEWGGGLRRIDRKTGQNSAIERKAPGEPCGGLLNPDCDPVSGIATEPWKVGCASWSGLLH